MKKTNSFYHFNKIFNITFLFFHVFKKFRHFFIIFIYSLNLFNLYIICIQIIKKFKKENIIIMKEIKTEKIWNINELLEKISQYEEIRPID